MYYFLMAAIHNSSTYEWLRSNCEYFSKNFFRMLRPEFTMNSLPIIPVTFYYRPLLLIDALYNRSTVPPLRMAMSQEHFFPNY